MIIRTELYKEHEVSFFDLSDEVVLKNGQNPGIWTYNQDFKLNNELIIGFSPTNYHTFIICGSCEYHTRFAFNKNKLRNSRHTSIRAGMFIRIKGISSEELFHFRSKLLNLIGTRTFSCIDGVTSILKKELGIEVIGLQDDARHLDEYVTPMMINGFRRNGVKLDHELYLTREKTLAQTEQEMIYYSHSFENALTASEVIHTSLSRIFRPFFIEKTNQIKTSSHPYSLAKA
ncbi:MAG: hypothetical protein EP319_10665 [Deltaproteobacteria bacterium]|nr:MAG: hypothetical protein EP319_10665 [Deltaproteobacteria bacterium]